MKKEAFVWRRQFSHDQMQKIEAIRGLRERFLAPELADACRFARCQLRDTPKWYNVHHTCDGKWQGKRVTFDFVIRPLVAEYAVAVYQRVLADALAYYPSFMRYEVVDGPLAGERRVIFPDRLDEAAAYQMMSRAWWVMEHTDIAVAESCRVTVTKGSPRMATVHLVVDRPATTVETRDEVAAIMATGKPFPFDASPRKCDPSTTLEMFAELSLPELALLNWDHVRRQLSAADQKLHAAIHRFDYEGVRAALAEGADPNCVADDKFAEAPLTTIASYKHWMREADSGHDWDVLRRQFPGPSADEIIRMIDLLVDAGAAIDWAPLDELTPLAEAALNSDAAVVQHLLDLGADPSIRCYSDELEQEWGTAWEFADYRGNPHANNDDRSAWDALIARWPAPFGRN